MTTPTDKQMIAAAKAIHEEAGMIEIDDDAGVSRSDDIDTEGAFVAAWVWIDYEDAEE